MKHSSSLLFTVFTYNIPAFFGISAEPVSQFMGKEILSLYRSMESIGVIVSLV